jgi:hypothetical protein
MNARRTAVALVLLSAGAALGIGIKSVLAEGIPSSNPLYYSGTLAEGGQLVNAPRQLAVNLWTNAAAQTGEIAICSTTVASTPVINGRFRIALESACKTAIAANPDVYVEVVVGNTTSLGRAKIGAVPFAIEADHATKADNATGPLKLAIEKIESGVAALKASTTGGGWQPLPLTSGFVPWADMSFGTGPQFQITGGSICLRGLVTIAQDAAVSTIGNLPVAARPSQHLIFAAINTGAATDARVYSDGQVLIAPARAGCSGDM